MAAKDVKAFFEKVEQDKSLKAKLSALHKNSVKASKKRAVADVVKAASKAGFRFTAADWNRAVKAKTPKVPKGELADVTGQSMCPGYGGSAYRCNGIVGCGYDQYW
jgi:predicted ribosomally synthesized peptide with nif11-like leader